MKLLSLIFCMVVLSGCGNGIALVQLPKDGKDGTNGTNATPVTMVQLCPSNFIPTYPSVYPEYALCINGNLYAVYSIPNAFLTILPTGNYTSNGINASCTFTIKPNCVIE